MDQEGSFGLMEARMMVSFEITRLKVTVHICGLIIESILANGLTIKCMVKESINGLTAGSSEVPTKMTRNTVEECLLGKMAENTKGFGSKGSKTEREFSEQSKVKFTTWYTTEE